MPDSDGSANRFIEHQLDARIMALEDASQAHAIAFSGPIIVGADDILRGAVEERSKQSPARDKLVVLLTTSGGYIEVVRRIVATLRQHYKLVDFIIPNYAFSAGTVLAMSGDAIYMDYYSRLGPIDPQVESQSGKWVSALGYLKKYEQLVKKAQDGIITAAEVQLLISGFDQADLYNYEQAREDSISLLKDWLVRYKFKNWKQTETRGIRVTRRMKATRAAQIARILNKTEKWHSHGYGISKEELERDLRLKIDDFGPHASKIRDYHDLLSDYMVKVGNEGAIQYNGSYKPFLFGRR